MRFSAIAALMFPLAALADIDPADVKQNRDMLGRALGALNDALIVGLGDSLPINLFQDIHRAKDLVSDRTMQTALDAIDTDIQVSGEPSDAHLLAVTQPSGEAMALLIGVVGDTNTPALEVDKANLAMDSIIQAKDAVEHILLKKQSPKTLKQLFDSFGVPFPDRF